MRRLCPGACVWKPWAVLGRGWNRRGVLGPGEGAGGLEGQQPLQDPKQPGSVNGAVLGLGSRCVIPPGSGARTSGSETPTHPGRPTWVPHHEHNSAIGARLGRLPALPLSTPRAPLPAVGLAGREEQRRAGGPVSHLSSSFISAGLNSAPLPSGESFVPVRK